MSGEKDPESEGSVTGERLKGAGLPGAYNFAFEGLMRFWNRLLTCSSLGVRASTIGK